MDNVLNTWNVAFPDCPMTIADLTVPHKIMGGMFEVYDRLEIDRDILLLPPPEDERDNHTIYYWDLIPVINMTRVFNHIISMLQFPASSFANINYILQPTVSLSQCVFLILTNVLLFNESKLEDIFPYEEELFASKEQTKILEDKKNKLLESLNEQANKKGKRAERLEKLDFETKQYEEELKTEKELHDKEKQELAAFEKEWQQMKMFIEQKTTQRDGILADIANKKALRVYDADDIRAQVEKARKNVQESEEKLNSYSETLKQKELSLKNLQTVKPNLDIANTLLNEITKANEKLKDQDEDIDCLDGDYKVLQAEISELQAQLAEITSAKAKSIQKRQENQSKRQKQTMIVTSTLSELEEKEKNRGERAKIAIQRTQELKELTNKYSDEKVYRLQELLNIKESFITELTAMEEGVDKVVKEAEKRIVEKINNRNKMT